MPFTLTGTWSAFRNSDHGPWLIDSTLYALTMGSGLVRMSWSTDGGSSWSSSTQSVTSAVSVVGVAVGSTINVHTSTSAGDILHHTFTTGTKAWAAPGPNIDDSTLTATTGTYQVSGSSTGSVALVFHNGDTASVSMVVYRRVYYITALAGGEVQVDGAGAVHYDAYATSDGASGRNHFFYTGLSGSTRTLRSKTRASGGSLGAEQNITGVMNGSYAVGKSYHHSGTVMVPYVATTGDLRVAYATSADAPTWSTALVASTNKPEYTNAPPATLIHDGTDWHIFWIADSDQTIWHSKSTDGGATWATADQWKTGITAVGVSARMGATNIGILYATSTTVVYDEYSSGPVVLNIAGTSAGTSTATGVTKVALTIAGTSAGTSTATANANAGTTLTISGTSAGTSTAAASVSQASKVAGVSAGTSTVSGATTTAATIAGASAGTAAATGATKSAATIAGTSAGTSTASANATAGVILSISGSSAGTSTASGSANVAATATGTSNGTSTATTATKQAATIAGASAGTGTATGVANLGYTVAGVSAGTSTVDAATLLAMWIAGASAGTSTATANAEQSSVAPVTLTISGSSAGGSSATAQTIMNLLMSGTVTGSSVVGNTGTLAAMSISGSTAGTSSATANFDLAVAARRFWSAAQLVE